MEIRVSKTAKTKQLNYGKFIENKYLSEALTSHRFHTHGLSPIFLRLLIFNTEQFANVRWNGEVSSLFSMHNGVRQGAVLSALAHCFYCEELASLLEMKRSGCWINGFYLGLLGYSDDVLLLH